MFLKIEGLEQWLACAWYVKSGVPSTVAIDALRFNRSFWSQDEGWRCSWLVPHWQRGAFADQPLLAEALLAKTAD